MNNQELLFQGKKLQEEIVKWRRHLHENPEIGMDLPNTSGFVFNKLKGFGLEPYYVGKTSIAAIVGKKANGKVILLRADMDALPMKEETGLEFSSKNDYMHSCGHDTHTAMLLGAAKLLKDNEDSINGRIKLVFQGGEEILKGAKDVIENGVLENPKVDAAMMIHIGAGLEFPHGMVAAFTEGPCFASSDGFRIDIKGVGGHASNPDECVDPNSIMVSIHAAIQQYISMGVSPKEVKVCSICEMHGGTTYNIIPDTAYMSGTIRTFNEEVRENIKTYVVDTSKSIAKRMGGEAEITFVRSAPVLFVDKEVGGTIYTGLREILGEKNVINVNEFLGGKYSRMMGSEDFSYYTKHVPSMAIALLAGAPSKGYKYFAHNPKTDFDENVFYIGSVVYAYSGIYWLKNN